MTRGLGIICAVLLIALAAAGQDKNPSRIHVISTGEITGIDAKKNTLKVRDSAGSNPTARRPQPNGDGRRDSARNRGILPHAGWGAEWPGIRGGTNGDDPLAGTGNGTAINQGREYKVFVTASTIFKDGDTTIALGDLKVGDRILISGPPKGDNVEAAEISRNRNDIHTPDSPQR